MNRKYMSLKPLGLAMIALAAGITVATSAFAQAWPTKPVRIIVPYAPAGTTDILARAVATELTKVFPQPFVVENRAGAGGNNGTDMVGKSAPDGHTLVMGTVATHGINKSLYGSKMPFDPQKDFAPVVLVAGVPNLMVMNTENATRLNINSVADFIKYAKANPGKLNVASSGNGTSIHLSAELFKSMTGTFMTHIPYTGSNPAIMGLLSGNVDVMFDNLPTALQQVRAGKLKAFAVTSDKRSVSLPDVPTLAEAEPVLLKGFNASSWFGLLAPVGTPPDVIKRIHEETAKALASPAIKERLTAAGAIPSGIGPQEFAAFIDAEIKKWAVVVKVSGAKID